MGVVYVHTVAVGRDACAMEGEVVSFRIIFPLLKVIRTLFVAF